MLALTSDSSSSTESSPPESDLQNLVTIMESEKFSEDHYGAVEFDLLEDPDSLNLMTISSNFTDYCSLTIPMGSVHSVFSSQATSDCHDSLNSSSFNMIIDSSCTRHMIPFHKAIIT